MFFRFSSPSTESQFPSLRVIASSSGSRWKMSFNLLASRRIAYQGEKHVTQRLAERHSFPSSLCHVKKAIFLAKCLFWHRVASLGFMCVQGDFSRNLGQLYIKAEDCIKAEVRGMNKYVKAFGVEKRLGSNEKGKWKIFLPSLGFVFVRAFSWKFQQHKIDFFGEKNASGCVGGAIKFPNEFSSSWYV